MKQVMQSLFAASLVWFGTTAFGDVAVVHEGTALPITVHPAAGKELHLVAEDLVRILEKMTGVRPELRISAEPKGVVLGTTEQFGVYRDAVALKMQGAFDGREAFIIQPDEKENRVWILGNREEGASHGVYTLLKENGYRALFPGENWEVFPERPSISVEKPSAGRPKVLTRLIWAGFGSYDREHQRQIDLWKRRNRLGASISGQIGHSWESMIRRSPEAIAQNRALLAMKEDGSENASSLRHGTEAVVDFTEAHLKRVLGMPNPPDAISIAPTDGDNYSHDEETLKRGEVNESFFWYVNESAKRLATLDPNHLIGTTAYFRHAKPPAAELEPNVLVIGATQFGSGGMPLEEFFEVWTKKAKFFGIRDYIYSGYAAFGDHPDGGTPAGFLDRRTKWLRDYSVSYYSGEGLWEFGLRGPLYYALAQVLWDPSEEPSAILEDFNGKAFGRAEAAMSRYYEAVEAKGRKVRKDKLHKAVVALQEAAEAAKGDAAVEARINDMKVYMVHVALMEAIRALPKNNPERLALTAKILEWNYRHRYSHLFNINCNRRMWMVNSRFLDNYLLRDRNTYTLPGKKKPSTIEEQNAVIAEAFGPDWTLAAGLLTPTGATADLPRATAQEIRERFDREVIPTFPYVEIEDASYSTEYVPVEFKLDPVSNEEDEVLWFGGDALFKIWRGVADKIEWSITPNVRYPGVRHARPFELKVELPDGSMKAPITLPQDETPHAVDFFIDQPGLTTVELLGKRQGFVVAAKDFAYTGLPMDAEKSLYLGTLLSQSHKNRPLYFYVPNGTREIQLASKLPDRLLRASKFAPVGGDSVAGRIDGDLIRIPVGEGEAGRVWQITGGGVGTVFYFLNLPNILNLHPGKMLLPKELVERDSLKEIE